MLTENLGRASLDFVLVDMPIACYDDSHLPATGPLLPKPRLRAGNTDCKQIYELECGSSGVGLEIVEYSLRKLFPLQILEIDD